MIPDDSAACPDNPALARRRIALFGVKYSANLGDGIIAECLASELEAAQPALEVVPIDLAGRTAFDPAGGRGRRALLAWLERLPDAVRSKIVPLMIKALVDSRILPVWRKAIDGCEGAIIGGGALIADADQNFPIKLEAALDLCRSRNLPVAIAHVGVTGGWSRAGHDRLSAALARANVVSSTFRDPVSRDLFATQFVFAGTPVPDVAPDPGLLSEQVYGRGRTARPNEGARRRIGVCVTNAMVLRLHGEGRHDSRFLREWLLTLVNAMLDAGEDVVLFTNGSPEDEEEKDAIARHFSGNAHVDVAPRFHIPTELAHFISGLDAVVAHRLHACIVAYAYGVPSIGLSWDRKLNHFFALIGLPECVVDPIEHSPFAARDRLNGAIEAMPGHEPARLSILADCRDGIGALAERLAAAPAAREVLAA